MLAQLDNLIGANRRIHNHLRWVVTIVIVCRQFYGSYVQNDNISKNFWLRMHVGNPVLSI